MESKISHIFGSKPILNKKEAFTASKLEFYIMALLVAQSKNSRAKERNFIGYRKHHAVIETYNMH